jgi:aminoglycoside phosphotransferase family enzyme/predicted kinase
MTHPKLIEAMGQTDFYPHRTGNIELLQTHISYIFIAGDFVYKVKKPLNLGFLDFSGLDQREYYCREELRLNRRLAHDVYLEVVEIFEDVKGNAVLGTGERIIEYAVKMKKLPRGRMLKILLSEGKVEHDVMDAIARKLVDFHRRAETGGEIDENGDPDTIRNNHDENFSETESFINVIIPEHQYRFIKSYVYDFIKRNELLFRKRITDRRIRDCHGDLHLEHICIMDSDIVIFDCIEFNKRFRYDDIAAEVAFLAMDLDDNGYEDYGDTFVNAYIRYAGDPEIRLLLNFYKCYYAFVRGKVVGLKTFEEEIDQKEREESARIASAYFDLAYTCAARLENPTLILMAGLMGTGKSVRAKGIAPRLGASVIQTDAVRKEIMNLRPADRHYEKFGKGIYAEDITRLTYQKALETAGAFLREGRSVIIDASYKNREDRARAWAMAKKFNADFFIIECTCPEEVIRARLHSRMADETEASDGRWEIFEAQKQSFHPVTEIPERSHVVIDASLTPEECIPKMIEKIKHFA